MFCIYICKIKKKLQEKTHKSHNKGKPIKITADFSMKILNIRRVYNNAQILEEHSHRPRLLNPAKLSAMVEGERKSFQDRKALKKMEKKT